MHRFQKDFPRLRVNIVDILKHFSREKMNFDRIKASFICILLVALHGEVVCPSVCLKLRVCS